MDIMTLKEASMKWNISVRRIAVLCKEGRIIGAEKIVGIWLIPKNSKKPEDARVKSGKYKNWRNNSNMKSDDFENNLKNLKGTFAVENMNISKNSLNNLNRIEKGIVNYTDVIEELKNKYTKKM